MSRVRSIGRLRLEPALTPADVRRVAEAAAVPGLWAPCDEGCCLICVAEAPAHRLTGSLRELMRSVLPLAGIRLVDGSVAVLVEQCLVTVTVTRNRVSHRVGRPGGPAAHRPAAGREPAGGGEARGRVIPLAGWR